MADSPNASVFGSGAHGREFPALSADRRAAIMESFNANNRQYFAGSMGFQVVDLREGYARLVAENTTRHQQPAGVMHGGASFGLADSAVAAALFTVYGFDQLLLTIEMKINYLDAGRPGLLRSVATVRRRGSRFTVLEAEVTQDDTVVAFATGSFTTISS
jgi:acyl-CoA thioesterase